MIAQALYNTRRSRVSYGEAFTRLPVHKQSSRGCSIQGNVSNDNIFTGIVQTILSRVNSQLSSRQALANIIVRLTLQFKRQSFCCKSTKTLTCVSVKLEINGVIGQSLRPVNLRHLIRQERTECPVCIFYFESSESRLLSFYGWPSTL